MKPTIYAVIMAGGVGSRFWPRSRERSPKQVLEIVGSGTMIQNTVKRIEPLVPIERVCIVTNRLQKELIAKQLPKLPEENILVEPVGRNTAPCVGLAAQWVRHKDPNGVMIVLPADHLIRDDKEFIRILGSAVRVAEENEALVTIGIKPTHPETGFGYIQFDDSDDRNVYASEGIYRVKTFAEKPNYETAEKFLKSGDFVWNSGIFIWRASVILDEIERQLPELDVQLKKIAPAVGTPGYYHAVEVAYGVLRGVSIDYGVMEKAKNVYVAKGDFGWSDVGSWDEVTRLTPVDGDGNATRGTVIIRDAASNYVDAGNKMVAIVGAEDLIVVSTDDAILICKKGHSQDVKEIVDYLRRKQMNEFL
jgi:mannose-1-phosphate guanylyltransferase